MPSQAERPPPTSVTASPAPPPASPADPSAGGAPPPESPQAELPDWLRTRRSGVPRILADGTHAEQQGTGDPYHRSRADDERATPGKQPTRSHSARPREHPDLYSDSEPWRQRGRHAGQRRGNRSPRQLSSPARRSHRPLPRSPAESRDIGRDITGNAIDGSSDDRTQDPTCDPHNGCCGVHRFRRLLRRLIACGVCLNTDAVELSPHRYSAHSRRYFRKCTR